jgi:formate dehydrogenase
MVEKPHLSRLAPIVLYETLGPTLPEGAAATAAIWGLAQTTALTYPASIERAGYRNGDDLFDAIMASPSGVIFTIDEYEETWANGHRGPAHPLGRGGPDTRAARPRPEDPNAPHAFPFVLSAGERRSTTANTIFRDPGWRRKDTDGALRMSARGRRLLGRRRR